MKDFLGGILLILLMLPAHAIEPDERLADPALEERARAITKNIRCLVCQNESIDDSASSLARDLRILVREQVSAGRTNHEIYDFVASRYGDVALFVPRMNRVNLGLYLSAPLLLLLGIMLVLLHRFRSHRDPEAIELDGEEAATVTRLLDAHDADHHIAGSEGDRGRTVQAKDR
ncbi:MAG: cytochrome c-type biogenesis protein CcmH [Rhodobacteraceae bacterium]|nr:cytochrome c-type biogenesis protein CcmH [Paracoccaceae bacterium]